MSSTPGRPRLVVATWNVHSGLPAPGGRRSLPESLSVLAEARPDLLAVQEVECDPRTHTLAPRSAEIFAAAGLAHRALFPLSPSHQTPGCALGVGIASRWPLAGLRRHTLPNPGAAATPDGPAGFQPHDKGLLLADVPTEHGDLTFGSVHVFPFHRFGSTAHDRRMAGVWDGLASAVDGIASEAIIVAGDFNTDDRTLLLGRLSRQELSSAAAGVPSRPSGEAFDDVLYSSAFASPVCSSLATFSDHDLVVAALEVVGSHGTARA